MSLTFGPMAPLRVGQVRYIVFHTLGAVDASGAPVDLDQGVEEIHRYHRSLGWSGVGYHWLVRKDGSLEVGRPVSAMGAHCRGINHRSIGIAMSGHGDLAAWTPEQTETAVALAATLAREYGIDLPDIVGHREINKLIDAGEVPEFGSDGLSNRTFKSCPGVRVSMPLVRVRVARVLYPPPDPLRLAA